MAIELLSPWNALAGLAGAVPLAALAASTHRSRVAARHLGLPTPDRRSAITAAAGIVLASALLAVALAQPIVRTTTRQVVRTDAELFVVIDTSRSMLAASSPAGRRRIDRARDAALRMRAAVADVPSGVASLTDRLLPHLFPTEDPAVFSSTVDAAIGIERPPPSELQDTATTYSALDQLAKGLYRKDDRIRLAVVLTDGETRNYDGGALAQALGGERPVTLLVVQLWSGAERVFARDGTPEAGYRPAVGAAAAASRLAAAGNGESFSESQVGEAAAALRRAAGDGPTRAAATRTTSRSISVYLALAAMLPLLVLILRGLPLRWRPRLRIV